MGACEGCEKYCAPDNPHAYKQREGHKTSRKTKQRNKQKKHQNTDKKKPKKLKHRIKQKMNAGEDYAKQQMLDQTMKHLI